MRSNGSQEISRVHQARSILERIHGRLLRPYSDALDASWADLNAAAKLLRELDLSAKSPIWRGATRTEIETEVVALRSTVGTIEALLESAEKFYAGVVRLTAPDDGSGNYTSSGDRGRSPTRAASGNVVLEG